MFTESSSKLRFRNLIVLTLLTCLIFVPADLSGSESDSMQNDELVREKLQGLKKAIESGKTILSLSELGVMLEKTPDLKEKFRPEIQAILKAALAREKHSIEGVNQGHMRNVQSLIKQFSMENRSVAYSLEKLLCLELMIKISGGAILDWNSAEYDRQTKNIDDVMEVLNLASQYSERMNSISEMKNKGSELLVMTLWEMELDPEARVFAWQATGRLLGGGPYWTSQGIEVVESLVAGMRKAYASEKDEVVKAEAKLVIDKLDEKLKQQ